MQFGFHDRLSVIHVTTVYLPTDALYRALVFVLCVLDRKHLTMQVSQLEAQLKCAGEGVEQQRKEMTAVLLRLASALEGVDAQLTESTVRAVNTYTLSFEVILQYGLHVRA